MGIFVQYKGYPIQIWCESRISPKPGTTTARESTIVKKPSHTRKSARHDRQLQQAKQKT
jgi:hypothetical protein